MTAGADSPVRILGFVNHIAPAPDIEESIAARPRVGRRRHRRPGHGQRLGTVLARLGRAGRGQRRRERAPVPAAPRASTASRSCSRSGSPARTSTSIAACGSSTTVCRREGWDPEIAVIRSELSTEYVASRHRRRRGLRAGERRRRPVRATHAIATSRRRNAMVALLGPEPVMAALARRRRRRRHRTSARHRAVHGVPDAARAARPRSPRTPASCSSAAAWPSSRATPGSASGRASTPTASRSAHRTPRYAATRAVAGVAHVLRAVAPDARGEPRRLPRPG